MILVLPNTGAKGQLYPLYLFLQIITSVYGGIIRAREPAGTRGLKSKHDLSEEILSRRGYSDPRMGASLSLPIASTGHVSTSRGNTTVGKAENDDIRIAYTKLNPQILVPRNDFEELMTETKHQCHHYINVYGRNRPLIEGRFGLQLFAQGFEIHFKQFTGHRLLTYGQLNTALDLLQTALKPGGDFGRPSVSFLRIFSEKREAQIELLAIGGILQLIDGVNNGLDAVLESSWGVENLNITRMTGIQVAVV